MSNLIFVGALLAILDACNATVEPVLLFTLLSTALLFDGFKLYRLIWGNK